MIKIHLFYLLTFTLLNAALAPNLLAATGPIEVKIIGGVDVTDPSDPVAQSTVLINGKLNRGSFTCTGSIIADDLVLTAGHCLGAYRMAELSVYFRTSKNGSGPIYSVIGKTRIQDEFPNSPVDWNDLALLRLSAKIPAGYKPAKILNDINLIQDGASVLLAGYGINVPKASSFGDDGLGVLRKVEQKILNSHYGQSEVLVDLHNKGACSGDSGGPAYIVKDNELLLFGATSRMTANDIVPGSGGRTGKEYACTVDIVYTNILGYQDWIRAASIELGKIK